MVIGWIVEVGQANGALLYVAAMNDAMAAEDLVRSAARISDEWDVRAFRPLAELPFALSPGDIKGPM
jgi:hypothetical protein